MTWDMPVPHYSHGKEARFLSLPEKWLLAHWIGSATGVNIASCRIPSSFAGISSFTTEEAVTDLVLHSIPDRLRAWIERHPEFRWSCLGDMYPAGETPDLLLEPQWYGMQIEPEDSNLDTQIDYLTCWVPEFDRFVVIASGADSGVELPIGHFRSSQPTDRNRIDKLIASSRE